MRNGRQKFLSVTASESGRASIRILVILILLAALLPVATLGWRDLYVGFLEPRAPVIQILDLPRGIGVTPVAVRIRFQDRESGLDEVIVRTRQRGRSRDILRKQLHGQPQAEFTIEFPGQESLLDEGVALLEIRAFDRSIWSNRGEKIIRLRVDYRRPSIEVLTSQHNARVGGSQVVFYRAFDEDLAVSGVKVGTQTFLGFPARGIDKELSEKDIHVAIYAIPLSYSESRKSIKLFAEDQVGNTASLSFYNKVSPRKDRRIALRVEDEFLRTQIAQLADTNFKRLQILAADQGEQLRYRTQKGSADRLLEQFKIVNERLRALNDRHLGSYFSTPRYDRRWDGAFLKDAGVVGASFGEEVSFYYGDLPIGSLMRKGYQILPRRGAAEVYAANDGVVAFSDYVGVYGKVLGIDHGLGLFSVYGSLGNVSVEKGAAVSIGQKIGEVGRSGFARRKQLYFELRVQGVPVDAREWWDASWYHGHIEKKIVEVKNKLGIPVYRAF